MNKYRVVRDDFAGYEAQVKRWWWPFWKECFYTNTSGTLEMALKVVERHRNRIVWTEEAQQSSDTRREEPPKLKDNTQ